MVNIVNFILIHQWFNLYQITMTSNLPGDPCIFSPELSSLCIRLTFVPCIGTKNLEYDTSWNYIFLNIMDGKWWEENAVHSICLQYFCGTGNYCDQVESHFVWLANYKYRIFHDDLQGASSK